MMHKSISECGPDNIKLIILFAKHIMCNVDFYSIKKWEMICVNKPQEILASMYMLTSTLLVAVFSLCISKWKLCKFLRPMYIIQTLKTLSLLKLFYVLFFIFHLIFFDFNQLKIISIVSRKSGFDINSQTINAIRHYKMNYKCTKEWSHCSTDSQSTVSPPI